VEIHFIFMEADTNEPPMSGIGLEALSASTNPTDTNSPCFQLLHGPAPRYSRGYVFLYCDGHSKMAILYRSEDQLRRPLLRHRPLLLLPYLRRWQQPRQVQNLRLLNRQTIGQEFAARIPVQLSCILAYEFFGLEPERDFGFCCFGSIGAVDKVGL